MLGVGPGNADEQRGWRAAPLHCCTEGPRRSGAAASWGLQEEGRHVAGSQAVSGVCQATVTMERTQAPVPRCKLVQCCLPGVAGPSEK
eukprot:1158943-Pelagomonas_calceolata.AAC.13